MISLEAIYLDYPSDNGVVRALDDVSLTVKRGEIFGILGRSGAGKSSLLRCINLLNRPTQGRVTVDNQELTTCSPEALRRARKKMGMIFQHFNLLESRNAAENVALPLELIHTPQHKIKKRVAELLELVGLADRQHHYPKHLSGGQKQRVAIARALACEPSMLLCDEATSALDSEATESVLALLADINQKLGLTIVLITHETDVIKQLCHRAGVMDKGKLVEVGDTFELFAFPKHPTSRALLQKQVSITPEHYQPLANDEQSIVIRLTFVGEDSNAPFISSLVKKFDLDVNIQHADLAQIQQKTIGYTVCEIKGKHEQIRQALEFIEASTIQGEILTDVTTRT